MSTQSEKSLEGRGMSYGRYAPQAFQFVHEGLAVTIDTKHGPVTSAHRKIAEFLSSHDLDWDDLQMLYLTDQLQEQIKLAIDEIGGVEKLNRHINGQDLCWGLRAYALAKWGLLARVVLNHWGIYETSDFGKIVFSAIKQGQMQKQRGDSSEDFKNVYDFHTAFDDAFSIEL